MERSTNPAGIDSFTTQQSESDYLLVAGERTKGRKAVLRIHSTNWAGESVVLQTRLMGSATAGAHDSPAYRKVSATAAVAGGTAITASGVYEVIVDACELLLDYTRSGGTLTVEVLTVIG